MIAMIYTSWYRRVTKDLRIKGLLFGSYEYRAQTLEGFFFWSCTTFNRPGYHVNFGVYSSNGTTGL